MPLNRVQIVRHNTAGANLFTGREGELTVDTDADELRIHDNSTLGGHRVLNKTQNDALYQAINAELTAIAALDDTAGIIAKTGDNAYAKRTLLGTASKITVTNGDGASGNPTITIPDVVTLVTPTITGTLTGAAANFSGAITASSFTATGAPVATLAQVPDRGFPAGTVIVFYNSSVPALWTLNTAIHDRVLIGNNTAGGVTGGSWTITGLTIPNHVHTINHGHADTFSISASGDPNISVEGGAAGFTRVQTHTHPIAGTVTDHSGNSGNPTSLPAVVSDAAWRPNYARVVAGTKDAFTV